MYKITRIFCVLLLVLQALGLGAVFLLKGENPLERLWHVMLMTFLIFWGAGLMVFTFLVWYRGNEHTWKKTCRPSW